MSEFVRLTTVAEVPPGEAREFEVDGRVIAVFNLHDRFVAVDGVCPHQGGPLADGEVENGVVTCPWHGWRFHLETGTCPDARRATIEVFPVKVEGDEILVALPQG
ncbi:Rieske (2Fe-2S) iron-sulfur domain protein [Isosphaera pallida ATCC 43644]|uniref:Rieske (2Fe-2S) iron-sulfur domain protein n=1 Tax=Isosphaera pallida (strain ATCC 43644 / DSM 9630 / IS1B) TaxID=575540 RepID=E8R3F2_ISOPI|nr:non-heme iron oxygenase ferredoxin subunit [Isosphaera pallida]ADV63662.1 Rieske (2Fe-2S) iron-sulfur domain protein [Isosphaera pallida ATCC 43644]